MVGDVFPCSAVLGACLVDEFSDECFEVVAEVFYLPGEVDVERPRFRFAVDGGEGVGEGGDAFGELSRVRCGGHVGDGIGGV